MMETFLTIFVVSFIFAIGAFIGDYFIPFFIKAIKGNPKPKQKYDYAEKEWFRTLSNKDK